MRTEGNQAYQEFVKQRSIAFGRHFDEFIKSRNLDIDDKFWPEQDKADFNTETDLLLAEWARRKHQLLASEVTTDEQE